MSEYNIMKELDSETMILTAEDYRKSFCGRKKSKKHLLKWCCLLIVTFTVICAGIYTAAPKIASMDFGETISIASSPIAATSGKKDVITIPTGIVKANPFVPYRKLGNEVNQTPELVNDIPKFDLIAPPEKLSADTEAEKILTTTISGILYDKYSPTAIIKIDGEDYLVKKGDKINKFTVVAIEKDSVTVKTGNNTYKAGIGELLTDSSVNHNDVSNLNKKFGGERR